MPQFYLLSIVFNFMAGICLAGEYLAQRLPSFAVLKELGQHKNTRGLVGGAALVVGFLKLLIRSVSTDVPVVGDLLPAVVGMGMGAALLVELFRGTSEVSSSTMDRLNSWVVSYKIPLGILGIVVSALHFFIPGALFL